MINLRLWIFLIFPFFLFFSVHSQSADEKTPTLLIGIIGDQTGAYDLNAAYLVLENAVDKMNRRQPHLVLHVGDIVESIRGINSIEEYRQNFSRAVRIMNRLEVPWYLCAGDHDVVPPQFKANSANREREQWWQQMCREQNLSNQGDLYYSFNFDDYHFIVLYSLENLHTDPRWGKVFLNKLSDDQIRWLASDLDAHRESRAIFVIIHHPMWYVWSNWSAIHGLLRQYPVRAVIAGHYHYDQQEQLIDNISYLVAGSTGGVVKDMDGNSGGLFEYMLMRVNNRSLTSVEVYEVNSDSVLELTPRPTMDRLQALSCMMDNCYSDELIYLEQGILQKRNNTGQFEPLTFIGLESLGNPIDLPIQINVLTLDSMLTQPAWSLNNQTVPATEPLLVQPGERIDWSNYSSVGQWTKPGPLWTCKIQQNPAYWQDKKFLALIVNISFFDGRQRWIRSNIRYSFRRSETSQQQGPHR